MAQKTHVTLDTQASLDAFRREHYLYVYTAALELTASPAQANAIATHVFENAAKRFATMPVPDNCDMYLSAQVHLVYAQQVLPPLVNDRGSTAQGMRDTGSSGAAQARQGTPATMQDLPMNKPDPMQPSPLQAQSVAQGMEPPPDKMSAQNMPPTQSALPEQTIPPVKNAQTVPLEQSANDVAPNATTQPPQAAFTSQVGGATPYPPPANMGMQSQAGAVSSPYMGIPPQQQAIPMMQTPLQPIYYAQYIPIAQGMPYVQVPISNPAVYGSPLQMPVTYAQAGAPSPVGTMASAQVAMAIPTAPPPQLSGTAHPTEPENASPEVLYNPTDTEFWTPDSDGKGTAEARPVSIEDNQPEPETSYWEDPPNEKPSRPLSLLNGLLTLAGLGSIGFLLYQLGILPKFF